MKVELFVQKDGHQVGQKDLVDKVKEIWREDGNKMKDLKDLELYLNTNENTCYYVINANVKGSFSL